AGCLGWTVGVLVSLEPTQSEITARRTTKAIASSAPALAYPKRPRSYSARISTGNVMKFGGASIVVPARSKTLDAITAANAEMTAGSARGKRILRRRCHMPTPESAATRHKVGRSEERGVG